MIAAGTSLVLSPRLFSLRRPSDETLPTVTVCVLSHNRRDKLRRVLASLTQDTDYPDDKLDVIVVDNDSADGTRDMIRDEFPEVQLIELPTNTGIGGWNEAFTRATGEYILQLDDDCTLTGDTLAEGVRRMIGRPELGILALAPMSPETGLLFAEAYPTGKLSYWGCSAILRRQMLADLGGFDGRFFFQAFELDLSIRTRAAGWDIEFAPDLIALHMTTVQPEQSPTKFYYSRRNLLIAAMKAFTGRRLLRVLWRLAVMTFVVGKTQSFKHKLKTILMGVRRGWQWRTSPAPAEVQALYEGNFIEFRPVKEQKDALVSNLFWALRPQLYPTLRDCPDVQPLPPGVGVRSVERYDGCDWHATANHAHGFLTHPAPDGPPATVTLPDVPIEGQTLVVWIYHPHADSQQVEYHVRVRQGTDEVAYGSTTFPPEQRYGMLAVDLAGVSGRCDIDFFSTMLDPSATIARTATHWIRPMLVGKPARSNADAATTAVMVTFNKLDLLKQSVAALRAQSLRPGRIVVVNNASTDSTRGWLDANPDLDVVHLPKNIGGAGGFHFGLRVAEAQGAKWSWLLDDDTLAKPDCLKELKAALAAKPHVGFACSLVKWKDETPCRMNIPQPKWEWLDLHDKHPDLVPVTACSFVSCLVNNAVIDLVGYPIKEFFIWYDDYEYTRRISKLLDGCVALSSEVVHLTPFNRSTEWSKADWDNLWKYRHGARNEATVTFRVDSGLLRGLAFAADVWRQTSGCPLGVRLRLMRAIAVGALWNYRKAIEKPHRAAMRSLAVADGRKVGNKYTQEDWDPLGGDGDRIVTSPPHPHSGDAPAAVEFDKVVIGPGTLFESLVGVVHEKALPIVFHLELVRNGEVVWGASETATYADGWRKFVRPLNVPTGEYTLRLFTRMAAGAANHHYGWANWFRPRITKVR